MHLAVQLNWEEVMILEFDSNYKSLEYVQLKSSLVKSSMKWQSKHFALLPMNNNLPLSSEAFKFLILLLQSSNLLSTVSSVFSNAANAAARFFSVTGWLNIFLNNCR